MALGYDNGNPFGDPSKFTRSTGEDEVNRFNQYMRSQPWWQQIRGNTTGDFNDAQKKQLGDSLTAQGIAIPHDFHLDEGGNFNQKSRTKRNLIIAGAIGAGLLTAGVGSGIIGGGAGIGGAAGAATGGAAATGAGGALASTAIGSGFIPAIAGGTGLASLGGGAAAAAGVGGAVASHSAGSVLAGMGKNLITSKGLDAAGKAVGAYGQTAADNRGTRLQAIMDQDALRLRAQEDNRAGESDAMAKLASANYIQNSTAPAQVNPKYGYGPIAPSDAQKQAAALLQAEMLKRIQSGGYKPSDISGEMNPGTGERISNYVAPGLSLASMLWK